MTNLEYLRHVQSIQRNLLEAKQVLEIAELKEPNEMVNPVLAGFIAQIDDATNAIAARIQRILDKPAVTDEDKAALQAEVDKLKTLGQDPENPIPAEG